MGQSNVDPYFTRTSNHNGLWKKCQGWGLVEFGSLVDGLTIDRSLHLHERRYRPVSGGLLDFAVQWNSPSGTTGWLTTERESE